MGSRFYVGPTSSLGKQLLTLRPQFGGSDDSGSEFDGNDSSLPFPKPLARSVFLAPDFDPTTFLANLSDRYQTLEDLRNELRELSQSLSKELLDLVNDNYQEFLSLGSTLRGGEEKVEEIRVGLLGFQRELNAVRGKVEQRRENVAALIDTKKSTMKQIRIGKSLLQIAEQIEHLEASLMIAATTDGSPNGSNDQREVLSDESDEEADEGGVSLHRLERHAEQYLVLKLLLRRHSPTQPYIISQTNRIARIKSTLSLDLEGALKAVKCGQKDHRGDDSRIDRLETLLASTNELEQPAEAA